MDLIMTEQFDFYAYLNRMKYIVRWGLMRNTDCENIQEHSLQVAILATAAGANSLAVRNIFTTRGIKSKITRSLFPI